MRFAFTADQLMFRDTVRDVLTKECPPTVVRKAWETGSGHAEGVWSTLAETGVLGVTASEALGGMGMSELDTVLVYEEAGFAALPDPLVETVAVGVPLLAELGNAGFSPWIEKAVAGSARFAVAEDTASFVPHASSADLFLFLSKNQVHAVPADMVKLVPQVSVDRARRVANVAWTPTPETLVAEGESAVLAIERARARAVLGTSAVLVGLARRMLDLAVEYAKVRHQFGRPIGSFQAVKHKLADSLIKVEFAKPMVYRAAYSLATNDPDRAVHVSMAKSYASDAATFVAKQALQVHGAIGYTIECDLHMFMKRAWALSAGVGRRSHSPQAHRRRRARARPGREVRDAMAEAYLVEAVRTPVGRRKGGLGGEHPADMGAHVLKALVERSRIDPKAVEDVIFGCVDTIGHQAGDIARTCWLAAGLPEEVPGTTIDRQCGSSQQAVHFAAQAVMSGTQDIVVAGGVQQMTQIPISAAMMVATQFGITDPFSGSKGWKARFGDQPVSQFHAAELIANKWDCSRLEMEQYALESHLRAIRAQDEGRFEREIAPYGDVKADEGPRRGTTLEAMAQLKTLVEGGRLTAAVSSLSSQIGSAARTLM